MTKHVFHKLDPDVANTANRCSRLTNWPPSTPESNDDGDGGDGGDGGDEDVESDRENKDEEGNDETGFKSESTVAAIIAARRDLPDPGSPRMMNTCLEIGVFASMPCIAKAAITKQNKSLFCHRD